MLSRKIPDKPRYDRTISIAQKFILEHGINKLPVDLFEIAAKLSLPIISASEYASAMNCTFRHVIMNIIKSNDGSAKYIDGNHFILYNERIASKGRIRWTLAHEIGHIILGHLSDFEETRIQRAGLTKSEYDVLEKEADFFASQILAPPVVLEALKVDNVTRLGTICGLSKEASENRYKDYAARLKKTRPPNPLEIKIKSIFRDFIHKKYCVICGHSFVIEDAKYCPVCGKRRIYWGDGKMIYDDGFEVDENGRAIQCPRCGNEETEFDGNHCIICGTYMVNKCAETQVSYYDFTESCGATLPGNARYCYNCGNISTFYRDELLKTWNHVHLTQQVASAQEDDNDPPF